MSWRGTDGAIEAARAGHDVVLSPSPDLYLDHIQSDAADETPGRLDVFALKDIYSYNVMPPQLNAGAGQARARRAGKPVDRTPCARNDRMQRATFPRAAALAENVWTPTRRATTGTISCSAWRADMARYRASGYQAADSAFAVRFAPAAGRRRQGHADVVEPEPVRPDPLHHRRQRTDGRNRPTYSQPLTVALPATDHRQRVLPMASPWPRLATSSSTCAACARAAAMPCVRARRA